MWHMCLNAYIGAKRHFSYWNCKGGYNLVPQLYETLN